MPKKQTNRLHNDILKNSGRLLQPFRLCNKLLIVLYLS